MAQDISTLSAFRIGKLTDRVGRLERALIEREAKAMWYGNETDPPITFDGEMVRWETRKKETLEHYRTLAENELIREGLVRPRNVREMER